MPRKKNAVRADGRIAVQVYIGRREDGTRQYKTVYGTTQKEADEKALAIRIAMKKGIDVQAERDTFGDWAMRWSEIKQSEVGNGMMNAYRSALKHLSTLNALPITKIRANDIQVVILKLAKKNPTTRKPSSQQTLQTVKMTARQVFQLAVENRVIDFNPAAALKLPSTAPPQERRALTDEEQGWIKDTPHRLQTAAMIMLYAGLRRGEMLALTWSDIDLEARTITVNKSVEMIGNKTILKPMTKTVAGMRKVDIPRVLAEYLGNQPKENLLVCPSRSGKYMTPSAWRKNWNSYLADLNIKYGDFGDCVAGKRKRTYKSKFDPKSKHNPDGVPMVIPPITAHWLRHTFATMLYLAGVDILTAKDQLGHADVKTTMEIYTHLDDQYKRRSMDKLDSYLNDKNSDASQMQVNSN